MHYGFKSPVALLACALVIAAQSTNVAAEPKELDDKLDRPNVVILIADDMGYSDIGAFGSEIQTPNVNKLAKEGISFTNFHVGATCSPTRSILLTGVDNHLNGLGNMHEIMADNQFGKPGYEGHLNDSVITLATVLKDAGYHTYMAGKWHLGATKDSIPHAKGFERSFALAESGADNWVNQPYGPMYERVHYFEGGNEVQLPTDNYFSSNFYTQKIIDYIDADRKDGKPFFVWMGYQAVHMPHQAPKQFIDKYNGVYDGGWEKLRRARLERLKQLGIVSSDTVLDDKFEKTSFKDWQLPDWEALSPEEKRFNARRMQTYAGMVDNMDDNIGKLMAYLEKIGEADNTLIVFLSDNGTDPNMLPPAPESRPWYQKHYTKTYIEDYQGDYSTMGQKGSFTDYGPGWAAAANTPHSYFKTFSTEGGLRVPFIAWFPEKIPAGRSTNTFGFVNDVYPTILEMAGVNMPGKKYGGKPIHAPSGTSAWDVLTGKKDVVHPESESIGYELAGSSAVFKGKYKLSRNPAPKGSGEWELYDISNDPSEVRNLAKQNPELVAELTEAYTDYEKRTKLVPVPKGYNPITQLGKNAKRGDHH